LDYSHRNEDGSVGAVPDSLKKEFKTRNGRKVYDGGGVDPDVIVNQIALSKIAESLLNRQLIFDYATIYRSKNERIESAKAFKLTEADFNDFKKFVSDKDYGYSTESERALENLQKKAREEKYFDAIAITYEQLKEKLKHDKESDIEKNKSEIIDLLEEEIARRYYFQKARYEASFAHDEDVQQALKLLNDGSKYHSLLNATLKK
jgi:carboxyl-terminal processing protease